ncbi:MAG: hypothetical protein ACK4N5_15730 [Myxococcales bacterium]
MQTWTLHFHGANANETLAKAELFFLQNKEPLGLTREEFFARLLVSADGREAEFVGSGDPLGLPESTLVEARTRPGSGPEPAAAQDAL